MGHGESPAATDTEHYTPAGYVNQLEFIRQDLGCHKWFVGGYSLGAGITVRYTHTYPQHVYAHLFTNSASGFAAPELVQRWMKDAQTSAQRIIEHGTGAIERIPVHPKYAKRLPAPIAAALVEDAKKLSPWSVAQTMLHTNPLVSARDIVADNPRPALLCFGKFEKRFHASKDWAIANMANLRMVSLEAGHAVNMEDSAGFNQAVTEFVRSHKS